MKKIMLMIFLSTMFLTFISIRAEDIKIAQAPDLEAFEEEMMEWAEGRWLNWQE